MTLTRFSQHRRWQLRKLQGAINCRSHSRSKMSKYEKIYIAQSLRYGNKTSVYIATQLVHVNTLTDFCSTQGNNILGFQALPRPWGIKTWLYHCLCPLISWRQLTQKEIFIIQNKKSHNGSKTKCCGRRGGNDSFCLGELHYHFLT